jgi:hypothetical protein
MLSRELRHALTEWPSTALASARTTARVTIIGNDDAVSVHVVADAVGAPVPEASAVRGVRISVVEVDDRMWVEATWTRTP